MEESYSLQLSKSNTPLWVFSTCFDLYKWYQIAQTVSYIKITVNFGGIDDSN